MAMGAETIRLVAAEHVELGAHTMLGPNVCVFDHDHVFDAEGVHGQIVSAPIAIGERCWLGAHALVTKGVIVADRICVGGGASSRAPWRNPECTWGHRLVWRAKPLAKTAE